MFSHVTKVTLSLEATGTESEKTPEHSFRAEPRVALWLKVLVVCRVNRETPPI